MVHKHYIEHLRLSKANPTTKRERSKVRREDITVKEIISSVTACSSINISSLHLTRCITCMCTNFILKVVLYCDYQVLYFLYNQFIFVWKSELRCCNLLCFYCKIYYYHNLQETQQVTKLLYNYSVIKL
jgi:hypothetical protein